MITLSPAAYFGLAAFALCGLCLVMMVVSGLCLFVRDKLRRQKPEPGCPHSKVCSRGPPIEFGGIFPGIGCGCWNRASHARSVKSRTPAQLSCGCLDVCTNYREHSGPRASRDPNKYEGRDWFSEGP